MRTDVLYEHVFSRQGPPIAAGPEASPKLGEVDGHAARKCPQAQAATRPRADRRRRRVSRRSLRAPDAGSPRALTAVRGVPSLPVTRGTTASTFPVRTRRCPTRAGRQQAAGAPLAPGPVCIRARFSRAAAAQRRSSRRRRAADEAPGDVGVVHREAPEHACAHDDDVAAGGERRPATAARFSSDLRAPAASLRGGDERLAPFVS
jgi:hypothetical protein